MSENTKSNRSHFLKAILSFTVLISFAPICIGILLASFDWLGVLIKALANLYASAKNDFFSFILFLIGFVFCGLNLLVGYWLTRWIWRQAIVVPLKAINYLWLGGCDETQATELEEHISTSILMTLSWAFLGWLFLF